VLQVAVAVVGAVRHHRRVAAGSAAIVYIRNSAVDLRRKDVFWIERKLLLLSLLLDRELVVPSLE
jgi:hypothetical protein